ncbi:MAG: DUF4136 domain-containing protein [Gammaproteobacteria bacterium]|nr:DUF4136 domain-containing protein [Gammaproteobacteria bacterium]MDH3757877.1 DUF4136 domain-containing protein [Gammaproteobacteria bacterium]MDH3863771.1 DUF4136 domain-containing protein [Gammaproteobacteria bacterium]
MLINEFRRLFSVVGILALGAGMTGCASDNIRSDYDPTADFSQYSTFNFFTDAGPEDTNYQSFFSKYMIAAITREMEMRGYTLSNDPDLLVNFNAILREKTDVRTTPAPMHGGYYGYRGGFYDPWMGYGYAQETHVSQYTEGTFNIDLVDARKKKLVWEAVGTGRLSQKVLEELEERVNIGVAKYFAKYPFTAGSNVPVMPGK